MARRQPRNLPYMAVWKRVLDLVLVGVTAPIWMVSIAMTALWVALDGHNPFYVQERVGRGGRIFRIIKLRTMVVNADAQLEAYLAENPEARAEWDETQKLKCDPRITRAGHFLRKTSIDELPQLLNVLKGDMSLVGPRPFMTNQTDLYTGARYYRMRPGLTGLWQVSDRNETSFAERVTFDDTYYQSMSLKTDMSILKRTVGVVLRGTGY